MILSGEKTEEYRDIKPYWIRRLVNIDSPEEYKGENKLAADNIHYDAQNYQWDEVLKAYYASYKEFDIIRFTNGYAKGVPTFDIESKGTEYGEGFVKWGANGTSNYFVLKLGKILSTDTNKTQS